MCRFLGADTWAGRAQERAEQVHQISSCLHIPRLRRSSDRLQPAELVSLSKRMRETEGEGGERERESAWGLTSYSATFQSYGVKVNL